MNNINIQNILEYNSSFNLQEKFDYLYEQSSKNYKFKNLMKEITSEDNIKLAIKVLKKSNGQDFLSLNKQSFSNFNDNTTNYLVKIIQNKFKDYFPSPIKCTIISKNNNTFRPFAVSNIYDKIIQQSILQVLEPICEAKFYYRSFGFRQNRTSKHAVAACMNLINFSKMSYSVDLSISDFFNTINHGKLLKQLWTLGVQDKTLLKILSKILKTEIYNQGVQSKGIIQSGILSYLFTNVILNELDWWIANQWDNYPLDVNYKRLDGKIDNSNKYRLLRKSNLKEVYIVRHANDFKIFCSNYKDAQKIFIATRDWLLKRLNLELDTNKCKITNLRKNYTTFLGIDMKAFLNTKTKKYTCKSRPNKKSIYNIIKELKARIKDIQWNGINKTKLL